MPATITITTTPSHAEKHDDSIEPIVRGDAQDVECLSAVTKAQIEWHQRADAQRRGVAPLGGVTKRLDAGEYKGMSEATIACAEWHRRQYPGPGDVA